jgi:DNA primase catalytic core
VDVRDDIYEANEEALEYWASGANGHAATSYLRRRGIDVASLPEPYRVGYARPTWTNLVNHLDPAQRAAALAAGIFVHTKDGRLIDRFRDRVIFPIREPDGRIAGFIGRSLSPGSDTPKYLNTAASETFNKSALFYGLHEADRASGFRPVLVEGPLDALALAATCHVTRARDLLPIATSGTALTDQHAAQIVTWCQRHNVNPIIAYDADSPGRAAAIRAGELLRDHGLHPHIATLPAGLDPAEHLAAAGDLTPFRARPAGTATPLAAAFAEQIIDTWHQRANPDWPETKVHIAQEIGRHLNGYAAALLPDAAGAACTVAAGRAGIHSEMLFNVVLACRPRTDIDLINIDPAWGVRRV